MAKKQQLGMDRSNTKKGGGKMNISDKLNPMAPSKPHTPIENKTQANRPVKAGGGLKRGDRRDMHPLYSTGKNKSQGGKRGPIGASTRKGGTND